MKLPRKSKYGNRKTVLDGIVFHSRREAERYLVLKAMERDGLVSGLQLQQRIPLVVNGVKVTTWVADFTYFDTASGRTEYEDVKGYRTDSYRIKAKLFEALYGQPVRET